jgi:hypothetical protein
MGLREQIANRKAQIPKKLQLVRDLNKPGADVDGLWHLLAKTEEKIDKMMDLYNDAAIEQ